MNKIYHENALESYGIYTAKCPSTWGGTEQLRMGFSLLMYMMDNGGPNNLTRITIQLLNMLYDKIMKEFNFLKQLICYFSKKSI